MVMARKRIVMKRWMIGASKLGIVFFSLLITASVATAAFQGQEGGGAAPVFRMKLAEDGQQAGQQEKCDRLIAEGKRLFSEELDYEGAARRFEEARALAVTREQRLDIYYYLSLVYFSIKGEEEAETYMGLIEKLVELDYSFEPDELQCPPQYIEIFSNTKKRYGALRIRSEPSGAEIRIGKRAEPAGETPLVVGLRAGSVRIELRKGKLSRRVKVEVEAGREETTPVYTLKRKSLLPYVIGGAVAVGGAAAALLLSKEEGQVYGSIQVNSLPAGARVYLDGSDTGQVTDCFLSEVSAGNHTVKLIKEGYVDVEQSLTVTKDQTAAVNVTLSTHTISVVEPGSETVWVTGEDVEIIWTVDGSGNSLFSQMANGLMAEDLSFAGQRMRMFGPAGRMRVREIDAESQRNKKRKTTFIQRSVSALSLEGKNSLTKTSKRSIPLERIDGQNSKRLRGGTVSSLIRPDLQPLGRETSENFRPQTLSNVKIELYKGETLTQVIAESVGNTGSYSWNPPKSLVVGQDYKIKVSCSDETSVSGESEQFRISYGYSFFKKWGSFGTEGGQLNAPWGLALDSVGNIYIADQDNSRVAKFTVDGTYLDELAGAGDPYVAFHQPQGVTLDSHGNIYVADTENYRIVKFTSTGAYVSEWGSQGKGNYLLNFPSGMNFDSNDSLYVADTGNARIVKYSSQGTYITEWGSYGEGDSQFVAPHAVAVDSQNNVYVIDADNNCVQKFASDGTFIAKWGTSGSGNGEFLQPVGIAADSFGEIYVADSGNHRICKFTSEGKFILKWGVSGSGDGQFNEPHGIVVDASGYVYVADTYNHRIQIFKADTL
jgi:DNA-binding beta-propeller fold protein YncE